MDDEHVPWNPWEAADPADMPTHPGSEDAPTALLPAGWVDAVPEPRRGVSRRGMLIGAGAVWLGAAGVGVGLYLRDHGLPGAQGSTPVNDQAGVQHVLRRAAFGATPNELAAYLQLGVSGTIERLLNPTAPDDLEAKLAPLALDFSKPVDVQRWFILRLLNSQRPLEEKMTLFWHGVLTSSYRDVKQNFQWMRNQINLLRTHGLGRLDDLIHAITVDPAMMWYLDLRLNRANAPNENYARELMELFTLGLTDAGGQPNYTQADVVAGARALTGWTTAGDQAVFNQRQFDAGVKTYLGHTGNLGLDDVVKIVCAHPSTPYHLAWRMWSFFAYEKPGLGELQPLIDAYNHHDHSIGAMVRAMLTSPNFFGDKAYRQRVKSPTEYVIGSIRALGVPTNGQGLPGLLASMGQELLNPPNVSGWDGDKVSANWMSTQAWMTRLNFANSLLGAASTPPKASGTAAAKAPLQALVDARQIATPAELADYFIQTLLDGMVSNNRVAAIKQYQTAAAAAGGPALTLHGGQTVPLAAVRGSLYLMLAIPEYQLN
ncbi:MAG TPA: DUF1800 domain-containing protein [Ktedonobacterales bacterium]|nr:DUF1800 domain-containing protein [Ktedonobacterales bacterium]